VSVAPLISFAPFLIFQVASLTNERDFLVKQQGDVVASVSAAFRAESEVAARDAAAKLREVESAAAARVAQVQSDTSLAMASMANRHTEEVSSVRQITEKSAAAASASARVELNKYAHQLEQKTSSLESVAVGLQEQLSSALREVSVKNEMVCNIFACFLPRDVYFYL